MIGFTGSKDKCDWLKNDLKFDHVFNYKETDVDTALKKAAPDGVDCYWDNVSCVHCLIIFLSYYILCFVLL